MATINPPAWMQAGSYPARNDRLALTALLSYSGFSTDEATPMRIRQGVKPSYQNYQLKVRAAATPNMTVIVSAGFCFIDQHDTGGVGSYVCVNDADVTLTVAPAGGAGQYRKDTVVASVYDAEYAGTASEWRLEIIQGPYAASAATTTRGTLPNNAQILADIAIAPSQTSVSAANITDVRNYTVAAGGILPVTSSLQPSHLAPGQLVYLTDTDRFLYGQNGGGQGELQKTPGAWTAWTPTWSTSTGSHLPSWGDATINCRYTRLGRTVLFNMAITFGSATNFGSGATGSDNWTFTLPVTSAQSGVPIGKASLEPGQTSRGTSGMAQVNNNSPDQLMIYIDSMRVDGTTTAGGIADSVTPWAWGSGYKLYVVGQYEASSWP